MVHWIQGFCQRVVSKAMAVLGWARSAPFKVRDRLMVDADRAELTTRRAGGG